MRPGTWRKKQRSRVPKDVHCALQSKGKESRVRLNHKPFVPFLDLDHQITRTDIDNGTFFSQFVGLGMKRYF